MSALVDMSVLRKDEIQYGGTIFKPDGYMPTMCMELKDYAAAGFTEVKNGIGEGGSDPIHQAQCDYIAYYSAENVTLFFSHSSTRS